MNLGDLRDITRDLPDDTEILYDDPNFSGPYHCGPDKWDIKIEEGKLLIGFPFEEPVD